MRFLNRSDAGKKLVPYLEKYNHNKNIIVLGLPRGGIPVAYEIAAALCVPLDVFIVRKLGTPHNSELAFGAIASYDTIYINDDIVSGEQITESQINLIIDQEKRELARREKKYRGDRQPLNLKDKIIILVDDGIATGASMIVTLQAIRSQSPEKIIVAVPVAPAEIYDTILKYADEYICLYQPEFFWAVASWYYDFNQTSDEEVCEYLNKISKKNKYQV